MDPRRDEGQNGSVQSAPVNPRCEDAIRRQLQLKKAFDTGVAQVSQEAGLERLIQPPWRLSVISVAKGSAGSLGPGGGTSRRRKEFENSKTANG